MNVVLHRIRRAAIAVIIILTLTVTTACTTPPADQQGSNPTLPSSQYGRLERGSTNKGEEFGNWVVQTAQGLVVDAYVRDQDKLGVVISPEVRPNEVRALARSLVQGFQRNFPNRDLTVLMYAPDRQLILTAHYDDQSRQIQYQ